MGLAANTIVGLAAGTNVGVSTLLAVQIASGQTVGLSSGASVAVSSLPAVQLASGQSVGIKGNVSLANGPDNPLPVEDAMAAKRQPIQVQVGFASFAEGSYVAVQEDGFNPYTVPNGFRLVIESIAANAYLPSGQRIVNAGVDFDELHFSDDGTDVNGRERLDSSTFLRGYVEPNQTVFVGAERNSTTGTGVVNVWVIGYLEPVS